MRISKVKAILLAPILMSDIFYTILLVRGRCFYHTSKDNIQVLRSTTKYTSMVWVGSQADSLEAA